MSVRQLIELRREMFDLGLNVDFAIRGDGLMVQGPKYLDRIMAIRELRNRRINVVGHEQKKLSDR
jgi:hypothetical protein